MSDLVVRTSDAEREQAVGRLREHAAVGRLTLEEFAGRLDEAYAARTRAELDLVLRELPAEPAPRTRKSPKRLTISVFGGSRRKGRWRVPRRTLAVSIFGGTTLDLRQAELDRSQATIIALSVFGGTDVRIPRGVEADVTGFAIFGGNNESGEEAGIHPGSPLVRVVGLSVFGGLNVRHAG